MYRVVICDDEKPILPKLQREIEAAFIASGIRADYTLVDDARAMKISLESERIDILFIDIDMPYYSGMELAGYINDQNLNVILIFVTSHETLVYQSFAYKPFAFVRKTHLSEDIGELSGRMAGELVRRRQELLLKTVGQVRRIRISDIVYMEAEGNYVRIVTQDDEIRHRETMSVMERELSSHGFLRCHKGYLVNPEYVVRYKSSALEVRLGASAPLEIPIGRSYEKETRRKLLRSI